MAENKNASSGKTDKPKIVKVKLNLWKIGLTTVTILFLAPLFLAAVQNRIDDSQIELSQAVTDIKGKKVDKVTIEDNRLTLQYFDGTKKVTTKESDISFTELIDRAGISLSDVKYETSDQSLLKAFGEILGIILPIGLMAVLLYYFLKAQNRGASDIFSFGKSKAKLFAKGKQDVTFDDVAGVDEAKKELTEIVDFLKNPAKYRKIGARTPKGVLLFGPSGVGKCITGDSLVWTNKGLVEIRDIPKYFSVEESGYVHGATLASFDPDNPVQTTSQASHWYDLGDSETIRVHTDMGHEIEGTPEHPLVILDTDGVLKFKKLENIQSGDSIAIKT
ncbi:MAG: hypothetical protein AAB546_02715, partial [Patescibacteria group bacterium]